MPPGGRERQQVRTRPGRAQQPYTGTSGAPPTAITTLRAIIVSPWLFSLYATSSAGEVFQQADPVIGSCPRDRHRSSPHAIPKLIALRIAEFFETPPRFPFNGGLRDYETSAPPTRSQVLLPRDSAVRRGRCHIALSHLEAVIVRVGSFSTGRGRPCQTGAHS
jgi:hypothetical protein